LLLGSRPVELPQDYQTPSAWASIGQLATTIEHEKQKIVPVKTIETLVASMKTDGQTHVNDKISVLQLTQDSKVRGLRTFLLDVVQSLNTRMGTLERNVVSSTSDVQVSQGSNQNTEMESRLGRLETQLKGAGFNSNDINMFESDVASRLEKRLDLMDVKVGKMLAKGDDSAIRFAGLGFTKPSDAHSWLEKEMPHHPSGLIVDAHMVFERVFYNMENSDTLQRLQQCYKIKVTTIADGVAITSFDSKIPKFFSKSHGHKVVKTDGLFFDAIASYQEWDDPSTGFRLQLQEELSNFEDIHGTYLDEYFDAGSGRGYSISRLALTESMGWIDGFITFIDTYYRELSKAKFGPAKSWHVTTRLAKKILDEVGTIRQSAQGRFEAGNAVKICQNIVWAVLKAHDVMTEYKRLSFKNHPSVATELVKFLAINTSFESIEKLLAKAAIMEGEVGKMKKQVASSVKAAASAANKADKSQKLSDALTKCVAKLEQK
jgi:hypothetical protein